MILYSTNGQLGTGYWALGVRLMGKGEKEEGEVRRSAVATADCVFCCEKCPTRALLGWEPHRSEGSLLCARHTVRSSQSLPSHTPVKFYKKVH